MSRDSFIFYKSFYEAINELNSEDQLAIHQAICEFSLYGKEPEVTGITNAIWRLIRPQLEANRKRYESGSKGAEHGKKGGRPKKNPKETPKEPQKNPNETPNENGNGNGNGNGNHNGNHNLNHDEKQSDQFLQIAQTLNSIINSNKNINHSKQQINAWAKEIEKLHTTNNVSIDRIIKAMDWYAKNINGEYVPVIESGSKLRSKFLNLEQAMERESRGKGQKNVERDSDY